MQIARSHLQVLILRMNNLHCKHVRLVSGLYGGRGCLCKALNSLLVNRLKKQEPNTHYPEIKDMNEM